MVVCVLVWDWISKKERALLAAGAADDDTKIMLTMQLVADDKSIL